MPDRRTDPQMTVGAFSLAGWRVEPQRSLITDGEREVHVEPKVMEVLLCLVNNAGEVVPRRTIVDTVWATEYITDSTLTRAISVLRTALGDDARAPHLIETIPKRGYRLAVEVEPDAVRAASGEQRDSRCRGGPLAVVAGDRVQLSGDPAVVACEHLLLLGAREIPLTRPEIVFGRGAEADLQILAPEVSRRHARLELTDGRAVIEDLGSKNGTQVNHRDIDGRRPLASGDLLAIGPASFVFRSLVDDPTRTREDA